jgi:hypothetical protein
MKKVLFPAYILVGALLFSCEQKSNNDQADKIAELEQKLARIEATQPIMPVNAETEIAADPATLGAFSFDQMEFNFGTIIEGKEVQHVFNFVNNGSSPLIISNISASCGCTTPDWTKTPINPGDKGFVKVSFNSTGKAGAQSPVVTIQANTNPAVTRLRLTGNVISSNGGAQAGAPLGPIKK